MARAMAMANVHGSTFTTIYWKLACRFRTQGRSRRRHDHNRHVEVALVATEAMAVGMELVAAVAVGMELVGVELAVGDPVGLALAAAGAVGGDKSQMTCTETARGVVQ